MKSLTHLEMVGEYAIYVPDGWHVRRRDDGSAPHCYNSRTNKVSVTIFKPATKWEPEQTEYLEFTNYR